MIRGRVRASREPLIFLEVLDALGAPSPITAIVDSGFTELLTLPATTIRALGLPRVQLEYMTLADDSVIGVEVFRATVLWDGQLRGVTVHSMEGAPLVGMGLLAGYRLTIDAIDEGMVTIQKL